MKKTLAIFLAALVLALIFPNLIVFSQSSAFVVEDGVLVSYNGVDTTVTVPSGVTTIGASAFEDNTKIKTVVLPISVTSISDKAFYNCTALSTVNGGTKVSYIGAAAFDNTPYLSKSSKEFLTIGSALLWYNGDAASVTLSDAITSIAPYAFLRAKSLKSFSAGAKLRSIGEGAFYECSALTTVKVTKNVSYIGAYAFESTAFLKSAGNFPTLGDSILLKYNGTAAAVTIPATVRQISEAAFKGKNLTSVTIPSSVFSIGKQAFCDCKKLTKVDFSAGLLNIGQEAFAGCSALAQVTTPSSLTTIAQGAFLNCTALKSVKLFGNSLYLGYGSFAYCTSLSYVLMSDAVTSVDAYAFSSDSALAGVAMTGSVLSIAKTAFHACPKLTVFASLDSFAYAALSPSYRMGVKGDANVDGKLNVIDATRVQRYMAKETDLGGASMAAAEVTGDADVSVKDATHIQKLIAKMA